MTAIDKLIEIAENEVGYLEKASNSSLYDKTANAGSNNYTKYWVDIAPEFQGEAWCACFVTWCFVQAFGKDDAEKLLKHYPYISCPRMASLFTLNANPQRGDIVIFKHNGTFTHTGIVTSVDGDYFETIEGNTSGRSSIIANGGGVCKKSYYNSNLPGTKFCRPAYEEIKESEEIDMEELAAVKAEIAALRAKYDVIIDKMGEELEALRKADEKVIYNYIDDNMPQWAHEGVQWCVDKGIIQGTGEGLGLDDKDLKYCTIIKRLAESLKV